MTYFWSFFDHFEHWLPVRSLLPMTSQLVGSGCTHNLLFVSDMGIWAIIEGERWDLRSNMIKASLFILSTLSATPLGYHAEFYRFVAVDPVPTVLYDPMRYKFVTVVLSLKFSQKLLVFGNYEWQSALSWFSHNSTTLEYSLVIFAITVVSTWVIPESLLPVIIKWFS